MTRHLVCARISFELAPTQVCSLFLTKYDHGGGCLEMDLNGFDFLSSWKARSHLNSKTEEILDRTEILEDDSRIEAYETPIWAISKPT